MPFALLAAAIVAAGAPSLAPAAGAGDSALELVVRRTLTAGKHPYMRWPRLADVAGDVERTYADNGWTPLWVTDGRPTAAALGVIDRLKRAAERGMAAEDYDSARLDSLAHSLRPDDAEQIGLFDLALSADAARFATALYAGRVNPRKLHPTYNFRRERLEVPVILGALRQGHDAEAVFKGLEPDSHQYWLLRAALTHYQQLAADTAVVPMTSLPRRLKPGHRLPEAPALRRLLYHLGDLPTALGPAALGDTLYDSTLVAGVEHFQHRQGIDPDGIIGDSTAGRLRRPLAAQVRQIELSLERWRWLPREFATPPIIVNIPAYRLDAFHAPRDDGSQMLSMDVVVGTALKTETPLLVSDMKTVIFHPWWDIPDSIMARETRPAALKDSTYLEKEGMELRENNVVLPPTLANIERIGSGVRVRQLPGPKNSLGRIKFSLPNTEAIYLHDTPARTLFQKQRRDFSHGCIRVADPAALAEQVLQGLPNWTRTAIDSALAGDSTRFVTLKKPIPVMLVYATAFAGDDGSVYFVRDLYGHDLTLDQMLRGGYPYSR